MILANLAYYLLPRRVRRPRLVRAPINYEDSTEAMASSRIMPALRSTFDTGLITRSYGGNLLAVIYRTCIGRRERSTASFDKAIARLEFDSNERY